MKKKYRFKKGDKVMCTNSIGIGGSYLNTHIYEVKRVYMQFGEERIDTVLDSKGSTTNGWSARYFIPAYQQQFNFGE